MKKKLLSIFVIIIIILCILFVILGMQYFKIKKLSSNATNLLKNSSDFKIIISDNLNSTTEIYHKDNIFLIKYYNSNQVNSWEFKNIETGEIKNSANNTTFNEDLINQIYNNTFCITTNISNFFKFKSNGNSYIYEIQKDNEDNLNSHTITTFVFSKETGLLEKFNVQNTNNLNSETSYIYEFNCVSDNDIQLPENM